MNLSIIDTKALAKEQIKLKEKYERAYKIVSELPMLQSDAENINYFIEQAYHNKLNELVQSYLNGAPPLNDVVQLQQEAGQLNGDYEATMLITPATEEPNTNLKDLDL